MMTIDGVQAGVLIRLAVLEARVGALVDAAALKELHDKADAERRLRALEFRVYGRVKDAE